MRGLIITKQAVITLAAEDWQLYAALPLSGQVAADLNRTIEKAFNRGQTRREIEEQALQLMRANREYGAMDTEPLAVLEELLDELCGDAQQAPDGGAVQQIEPEGKE